MTAFLIVPLATLFVAVPIVVIVSQRSRRAAAWVSGLAMAAGLAPLVLLEPLVQAERAVILRRRWLPEWGIDLALRLDGLSLLFAILILGIGVLIVLYAAYYLPQSDRLGRFYGLLLAFAGGMLGMVLSENLIQLVIFWEVTSLSSFLLIAYKHEAHDARISARMALAVTGGGGLALLAGVMLIGSIVGSYDLSVVLTSRDSIRASRLYPVVLV